MFRPDEQEDFHSVAVVPNNEKEMMTIFELSYGCDPQPPQQLHQQDGANKMKQEKK